MASKSNYQFLTEPDGLKCLICLEVAKDPKQHGNCGRLFCSECIEKYGSKPCPNCRVENPQYFLDMRSLREIKELPVRCDNLERGCVWEGTVRMLDDHVTKCGFTPIFCPNKCKVEGEETLMRKDLDDHLKTKCPNRDYECKHCGGKGTYAGITEEHDSVCIKKIVSCPNAKCTSAMERRLIKKHIRIVCNYTLIACKYASIGCSEKMVRMDIKQHEEDDNSHLRLALEKIVKLEATTSSQNATIYTLKATTSSLEATTSSLKATTSSLEKSMKTLKRDKSISFNLPGYSKKKEGDVIFYSERFYTSPGGYKVCVEVYPNGVGASKGTHVSVYLKLLKGPSNNNLPWPFLGAVTVELLNQLTDDKHHSIRILINTTHNAQVGSALGHDIFIPHSKLSHDQASNTCYLMEDTLYFRVTVEVDQHKAWLHCTHPTK